MISLRLLLLTIVLTTVVGAAHVYADVPVFIYHRFDEPRYPSTNISKEIFSAQLAYLRAENYQVLPLSELARLIREGEDLPQKTVGLCIDDAFTSFARHAVPLLQEYGFPATLFVNTDSVGTPGYLNWDELRDLLTRGIEIGNHTSSHAYLVEMAPEESVDDWKKRLIDDISRAQRQIKLELKVEPDIFAYTYGEYSPQVIEIIRELGFKSAFAQQSGVLSSTADIWTLPRFPMGGPYANLQGFKNKLKMDALEVISQNPVDPVIRDQNPPVLKLLLQDKKLARGQINCFAQGGINCQVHMDPDNEGGIIVTADAPLPGRRNKYTLTVLGRDGQWSWFSQLWINAKRAVGSAPDQP